MEWSRALEVNKFKSAPAFVEAVIFTLLINKIVNLFKFHNKIKFQQRDDREREKRKMKEGCPGHTPRRDKIQFRKRGKRGGQDE